MALLGKPAQIGYNLVIRKEDKLVDCAIFDKSTKVGTEVV